jgi:hypothetical protein
MLSGGEKAKLKNIVMAIKGEYPKILDVLDKPKFEKNQNNVDELFACNKRVFMWLAHLPTTLINSNEVLMQGFDALQESNRFSSIKVIDHKKVDLLINSIEMIPAIQAELIKMITDDNTVRDRILKDIMDELGIENPNKKKKKDKKFSSMSFDDWFNDD